MAGETGQERFDRMSGDTGSRPVPDPTVLTTTQLLREIAAVNDRTELLFTGLREIMEEKFDSVDRQLALGEQQRVEQKADTKAAVDAALTAQKEAVKEQTSASGLAIAKSEAATKEQLTALNATFTTAVNAVSASLNDLKDRVVAMEAVRQGGRETISGFYALAGLLGLALTILIAAYVATH
jgi:hypothetical protein